jgi:hypothetical protein
MKGLSISYQISGTQSIARLDPLLQKLSKDEGICMCPFKRDFHKEQDQLNFVWETSCRQEDRYLHRRAFVLNRLHNSQVIEDKGSLVYLQKLMIYENIPVLETLIASGCEQVAKWASQQWRIQTLSTDTITICDSDPTSQEIITTNKENRTLSPDWWVVKASKGNGGRDIWVLNGRNIDEVINDLQEKEEYVIQRYVMNPYLWNGRKFHYRVYAVIRADMSALLYQKAFILTAGMPYDCEDEDVNKHITNLSVNKRFAGHPGQIPVNLYVDRPQVHT